MICISNYILCCEFLITLFHMLEIYLYICIVYRVSRYCSWLRALLTGVLSKALTDSDTLGRCSCLGCSRTETLCKGSSCPRCSRTETLYTFFYNSHCLQQQQIISLFSLMLMTSNLFYKQLLLLHHMTLLGLTINIVCSNCNQWIIDNSLVQCILSWSLVSWECAVIDSRQLHLLSTCVLRASRSCWVIYACLYQVEALKLETLAGQSFYFLSFFHVLSYWYCVSLSSDVVQSDACWI